MQSTELSTENARQKTINTMRRIAYDLELGHDGFAHLIGFDFTGGYQMSLQAEIDRLKAEFAGADENKIRALEGLIEQAAYERLYLKLLNEQAIKTGLVEFHPENAKLQRTLPVSQEIARHSAALTHIMDKLLKHLGAPIDDDDEGLGEYE
jgi:hypothetical protein